MLNLDDVIAAAVNRNALPETVIQMRYDVEDLDAATRLMQAADALELTYDLTKRFNGFTLVIYASGSLDTSP